MDLKSDMIQTIVNVILTIIVLFLMLLCIKKYVKYTTGVYKGTESLKDKTAVVTGAHTGIGFEAAKDFANRGARVIMVCNEDKANAETCMRNIMIKTGNVNIKVVSINFASLKSIRQGAYEIATREVRIHILLNNFGSSDIGHRKTTPDGLNLMMQVNYYGMFLFTNILVGKMRVSAPSRIVNVSSKAHIYSNLTTETLRLTGPLRKSEVYANASLARILFTNQLAEHLKQSEVTVNSLHPGTFLSKPVRSGTGIIDRVCNFFVSLLFKSVDEGAQTSIYLCVSPDVENVTGEFFVDCKISKSSTKARNLTFAKEIWKKSEEAVRLKTYESHYY